MKKTIILIAPSEWKTKGGEVSHEQLTFVLKKPLRVSLQATEKDLKCKWERYREWIALNQSVEQWPYMSAIHRYAWAQYKAIGYDTLTARNQKRIDDHVIICSGMYGLVKPRDQIANYKLPIWTKGLYKFRKEPCTEVLKELNADIIINLLPWSYTKMFDRSQITAMCIQPSFYKIKNGEKHSLTHMVKKYRGLWLRKSALLWNPLAWSTFDSDDLY
jgi:hypothetical protein